MSPQIRYCYTYTLELNTLANIWQMVGAKFLSVVYRVTEKQGEGSRIINVVIEFETSV